MADGKRFSAPHQPVEEPDLWLPVPADGRKGGDLSALGDLEQVSQGTDHLVDTAIPLALPPPEIDQRFRPGPASRLALRISHHVRALADILKAEAAREREYGIAFNWYPVWFGCGCGLYLALPREPLAFAFPLLALCLFLTVLWVEAGRRRRVVFVALLLAALGVCAGQVRVSLVDTKMLAKPVTAIVTGEVAMLEKRADGRVRYTLTLTEPLTRDALARGSRLRISARKGGPSARVGDVLRGRARVSAASGPAYPGGYSFAFDHWFRGLSASGFFMGAPEIAGRAGRSGILPSLAATRSAMSDLIREALPGRAGGLAAALIVGDRSGIDEETAETLRRTGLAHILAISGLHMALVTATVLLSLRLMLVAIPGIAVNYPVRKIAAGLALFAAAAYLALSGASVSTQRAFVMIAIMLVALLADRRALTMRNVAIAALVVLALAPESIVLPGFQMSFAAVAALVATYEALRRRADRNRERVERSWLTHGLARLMRNMGALALTSLVAGLATGLFAAYHFHRVAPLGLIANLGAMPLVSLLVMPMALAGAVLMPFGLEKFPLAVMGWGIDGVMAVASRVAAHGPQGVTGIVHPAAVLVATAGLLILCLMQSRLRLVGLAVLALATLPLGAVRSPVILVLENGAQVGVWMDDGRWALMRPRAEKFNTRIWARAFPPSDQSLHENGEGFACDRLGCTIMVKGKLLAVAWQREALIDDCRLADIVVTRFSVTAPCAEMKGHRRPQILTLDFLRERGSQAFYWSPERDGFTASAAVGSHPRPWTRHRFGG